MDVLCELHELARIGLSDEPIAVRDVDGRDAAKITFGWTNLPVERSQWTFLRARTVGRDEQDEQRDTGHEPETSYSHKITSRNAQ